jgi:Pyruvate/2-oxoacid:ferredoxin oxidoreductase gamma subunit
VATGIPPERIVIVTDIGCSGLSDRHFQTNAFHGLHGRSITYGTGIRLARPELKVVVLLGDGGCGIGGTHLINAARRNVGLTVLVSNNFNFGMTGGEHSVTTPTGGLTSTTPTGNLERPLDLCALVDAAGGTFIARSSAQEPDLDGILQQALAHEGFAFLDVWSVCSAYYGPRNRLTPKALREMAEPSGLAMGILKSVSRPEFALALREANRGARPAPPREIVVRFEADLEDPLGVIVAGSAGQRVRSGAGVLGRAAIACGLYATQKDDYPITVRTGHSLSEIILSSSEIHSTAIASPDVLILLSEDGLGQVAGRLAGMEPGGLVLADEGLEVKVPEGVAFRALPFRKRARALGKASVTVLALGAFLGVRPVLPEAAYLEAAGSHDDPAIAKASRRAAESGTAMGREG